MLKDEGTTSVTASNHEHDWTGALYNINSSINYITSNLNNYVNDKYTYKTGDDYIIRFDQQKTKSKYTYITDYVTDVDVKYNYKTSGTDTNWITITNEPYYWPRLQTDDWNINSWYSAPTPQTHRERLKARLRSNMVVSVQRRGAGVDQNIPENERIAIDTLREMVTEEQFRKYVRYGFVLVQGASGDVYQVFRNRSHTRVWRGGKVVEEICIHVQNGEKVPPTDEVIAFKTMIETDEAEFKKMANVYPMKVAA